MNIGYVNLADLTVDQITRAEAVAYDIASKRFGVDGDRIEWKASCLWVWGYADYGRDFVSVPYHEITIDA